MSFSRHLLGHVHKSDLEIVGKCVRLNFQPFKGYPCSAILKRVETETKNQGKFFLEKSILL